MKVTASIHNPLFFNSTLPISGTWGTTSQRIARRRPAAERSSLNTDDLNATKQEIVCGGILGLCALYTFAHCFLQLAF